MTSTPRPSEPGASGEVDRPWVAEQSTDPARAGAAAVRGPRRWGWFRVTLVVLAGMMALVCLGLVGLGFVLYNEETRPDRSAPDVVVDNYLRAMLVERDDVRARTFSCRESGELSAISALRREIEERERQFNVDVRVSWGVLQRERVSAEEETVTVDLIIAGFANGQSRSRRTETWKFDVVSDDGWRVCAAREM